MFNSRNTRNSKRPGLLSFPVIAPLILFPVTIYFLWVIIHPSFHHDSPLGKFSVWAGLSTKHPVEVKLEMRRLSADALRSQGAKTTLRENLREDREFLTSFMGAGFNNQVLEICNLIYLATLSNRIPILPAFFREFHQQPETVPVSDVFDLHRLSSALANLPIVEMHELKVTQGIPDRLKPVVYDGIVPQYDAEGRHLEIGEVIQPQEPRMETIGCWSYIASKGEWPYSPAPSLVGVETPWTPVPRSCFYWEEDPGRPTYFRTAKLLQGRDNPVPTESTEIINDYNLPWSIPPDGHVACMDTMLGFSDNADRYDVGHEYLYGLGAWARVALHMPFAPKLKAMADDYIRMTLGLRQGETIPPFLAVHIRRGDAFKALTPRHYAHAASRVMESAIQNLGIDLSTVVVTSDEQDPAWFAELYGRGWNLVNHTLHNTVEKHGNWLPTLIDTAILSSGRGFVGIEQSTMAILSYRRTIDWNNGVGVLMPFWYQVPEDWE